jgi:hypothetical protein
MGMFKFWWLDCFVINELAAEDLKAIWAVVMKNTTFRMDMLDTFND